MRDNRRYLAAEDRDLDPGQALTCMASGRFVGAFGDDAIRQFGNGVLVVMCDHYLSREFELAGVLRGSTTGVSSRFRSIAALASVS